MNKKLIFIIPIAIVVFIAAAFVFWKVAIKNNIGLDNSLLDRYKNEFSLSAANAKVEPFTLVPNKVSVGGYISVTVPSGFNKEEVKNTLKFDPEIKGEFVDLKDDNKIAFKPKANLKLGQVYAATISSDIGDISGDFVVAEKPKIVNIFPNEGNEIDTNSNITIVFNRPIVPLSIVDIMDDVDLPITITPKTEGRFKWIGTNTLQFIPAKGLVSSSNYKVQINKGFNSADGVKVDGITRSFKTKTLRYESVMDFNALKSSFNQVMYKNPVFVRFNQNFDLDKTKKEIVLKDFDNKSVDFVADYGLSSDGKSKDKTVLVVYQKEDQYGRSKIWNFESKYYFKLNKAYPENGNIILDKPYEINILTTGVYSNVSVVSNRASSLRTNVFDPKGKLSINFYEDVDLNKTIFNSDKISDKSYGKKCKDENLIMPNCDQEDDKKNIILSFNDSKIGLGESFKINIDSVINADGLKVNSDKISIDITSFDSLKIYSTFPKNDDASADLSTFVICSNNPLTPFKDVDVKDNFKSNVDFTYSGLQNSYYIDEGMNREYVKCANGQYETRFGYVGFAPNSNYKIDFKVSDLFDQSANSSVNFSTLNVDQKTLNFFHYQGKYNITTTDKTILTFAGYNMDYIDMNVCEVDPVDMLSYLNLNPNYYENNSVSKIKCISSIDKKIELPQKYWSKNYFKVNLRDYFTNKYGHFIFTFTNPDYKDGQGRQVYERSYLTVTNLNVVEKKINPAADLDLGPSSSRVTFLRDLYYVSNISDLKSITGAQVNAYISENIKKGTTDVVVADKDVIANDFFTRVRFVGQAATGADGVANLDPVRNVAGVVVKAGDDSAIIASNENRLNYSGDAYNSQAIYLYSDRPIYKPGDTIQFKGIYRVGYDGTYQVFKDKKIPVSIYDANGNEVYKKEIDVNDFGSFNDSFVLSPSASIGTYRIESKNYNSYNFSVEQYVPASFKIDSKVNKNEFIAGEDFSINLDASYYFGAPIESGKVEYTLTSTDYYFDKYNGDGYYNFTNNIRDIYYRDYFAFRGSTDLVNGKALINGKLDFAKFFKEDNRGSKIFNIYMNVSNSTGNSVTAVQSFIVHGGKDYIGINTDKYFLGKGENFNLKLKTLNTNGEKVSLNNIDLKINKITWIYNKRKEVDGSYYYNWERKYDLVKQLTVNSNASGDYSSNFNLKDEGEYAVIVSYKDELGNLISSSTDLYVYGKGIADIRPGNDTSLDVVAEKTKDLNVGERAKVIIKNPYKNAKAFVSIERGRVLSYEIIDINQSLYEYSFDLKKEYAPNVYLSIVLMSSDPGVKYSYTNFEVNSKEKELNISLKTNKDSYLPGERVSADIYVVDSNGAPVKSEVSMAVVDMSVLALKGNPKKDPASYFYNYFPLNVSTASNLKNILYEVDVENDTKGGDGGDSDLSKKKRGDFRDTAFWNAVINTDANGFAHVEFKLPDNLTTWQIETLGITVDTKLGVSYKEFVSKKDLMLTPLKPRFAILGDEFLVGAKLFNQTSEDQVLNIAFDSGYLEFKDQKKDLKIEVKKGESKNIYFKVAAPLNLNVDNTSFTVSASNSKYKDAFTDVINIKTNDVFETVATSSYSKDDVKEYVYLPNNISSTKGQLTINNSASLLPYLKSSINYISNYDDSSTEGIVTKLSSVLSLNDLNNLNLTDKIADIKYKNVSYKINDLVSILLSDLYKNYRKDSGFVYYSNYYYTDYYLTLYSFGVLTALKDSGYQVSDDIYKNLQATILNNINNDSSLYTDKNTVIVSTYLLNQSLKYNAVINVNKNLVVTPSAYSPSSDTSNNSLVGMDSLFATVKGYLNNSKFLQLDSSNVALIYLAELSRSNKNFDAGYVDSIYKILENRIKIDSRGAFLEPTNAMWRLYESSVSNTAMFVGEFASLKKESVLYDKLLRWLNYSKNKDGYWNNAHDTLIVVDAFNSYIAFKKENNVNFNVDVLVNTISKGKYPYSDNNISTQNSVIIPISDLKINSLNSIAINKSDKNAGLYYDIALKYYLPSSQVSKRDEGFVIDRGFYKLSDSDFKSKVNSASVGEVLKGRVEVVVSNDRNYVNIDSYIPAGFELVNFALSTESQNNYMDPNVDNIVIESDTQDLYPDFQEIRDDRLFLFRQSLTPGVYKFDYYVRALIPGKYNFLPSYVYEKYTPENFGRSDGGEFVINQ